MSWRDNPIFQQLVGDDYRLSLRRFWLIAGGLAILTTVLSVFLLYSVLENRTLDSKSALVSLLVMTAYLYAAGMPPIVALRASALASGAGASTDAESAVPATSNRSELTRGYVLVSFYRARNALAVLVGLIPLYTLGATGTLTYFVVAGPFVLYPPSTPFVPGLLDIIGPFIVMTMLTAGLLWLNVLAAALATVLGLRWRGRQLAGIISFAAITLAALGGVLAILTFIGPMVGGSAFSSYAGFLFDAALPCGLCVLLPVLITSVLPGVFPNR